MRTVDELYEGLRADPVKHLGRKSVTLIHAYELGYELACGRWGWPLPIDSLSADDFQRWITCRFDWTDEMGCRQNVVSFALLMSDDERDAFDLYFKFRSEAIEEIGENGNMEPQWGVNDLLPFILNDRFRNRPGMWFGSPSVDSLWTMCNGFVWAERDHGLSGTETQAFFAGFQRWIEKRYPFSKGRPWNKTIDFLSLHHAKQSWDACFGLIELYLAGEGPDSLSPTARQMLEGIRKQLVTKNPDITAKDVERDFGDAVKGIAPI